MAIYQFRCLVCGYECDGSLPIKDRDLEFLWPKCGHDTAGIEAGGYDTMTRVPATTSFVLKGKGWAKDGYTKGD